MFETQLAPVKAALSSCFGNVYDLFGEINIPEHRNELLCFAGIDGYTLTEAISDSNDSYVRGVEAKYLIEVLGKRNMSARELCDIFDEKAVPALEQCDALVKDIKRNSCRYSKEQGGYIISAELVFSSSYKTESTPPSSSGGDFTVENKSYGFMRRFTLESTVKTSETPLLGGTIKSRIVGCRPSKLKIYGETAIGGGAVYSSLKASLGKVFSTLIVGGISLTNMAMTAIDLDSAADGTSKITIEYTEVNDV